jgi:hypothetical protein
MCTTAKLVLTRCWQLGMALFNKEIFAQSTPGSAIFQIFTDTGAWFRKRCFWVTQASGIIPLFKAELVSNVILLEVVDLQIKHPTASCGV